MATEVASMFTSGVMQEFVLSDTIPGGTMSLNFDEKTIKSVKVRRGEIVLYDGIVASFTNSKGEIFTGRSIGVKSAILKQGWLVLKNGKDIMATAGGPTPQPYVPYDDLRGGEFETYKQSDGLNRPVRSGKLEVIRQEDRVVKTHTNEPEAAPEEGVVTMDSSPVATHVSSSTSVSKTASAHSTQIVRSSNSSGVGAAAEMQTIPRKSATQQKKKSYMVDDTTPRLSDDPSHAPTLAEIKAATNVVAAADGQDSRVVKKIGQRAPDVQEMEGITLKKGGQPRYSDGKATVSGAAGGTPTMPGQETTVVKKIGEKIAAAKQAEDPEGTEEIVPPKPRENVASAVPAAFKKPPVTEAPQYARPNYQPTRKVVPLEVGAQRKPEFDPNRGGDFETALKGQGVMDTAAVSTMVGAPVKTASDSTDYIKMLPDTWSEMHWVQKEKFVLSISDRAFLEFIVSVETTPAVVNACNKRLEQLDKEPVAG